MYGLFKKAARSSLLPQIAWEADDATVRILKSGRTMSIANLQNAYREGFRHAESLLRRLAFDCIDLPDLDLETVADDCSTGAGTSPVFSAFDDDRDLLLDQVVSMSRTGKPEYLAACVFVHALNKPSAQEPIALF